MSASVYMTTLGCRLNEAELVSWSDAFERAGHRVVAAPHEANVLVLNTCAVTSEAARKSRKLVGALHRKNPSARLVVTGCMAELEPEKAAALVGVDLVVGNHDKDALVETVLGQLDLDAMPAMASEPDSVHMYAGDAVDETPRARPHALVQLGQRHESPRRRTRAFIKVQDGCRNHCSYCVVTIARGEERSRSIAELIGEINRLADKGYREAVLTGVHLGGYGHDLGTDLSTLVRTVLAETGIERLRLSSLEPWDLPDDFGALWQDPRLMPHLHLPLQSGSDSVLRRMSRRCFRKDFRTLLSRLRRDIPDLNVTTDLIVGFPGESDDEFRESLEFCEEMAFGHMHIFGFSPREGTKAARLPGRVNGTVIRERSRQMHRLAVGMKTAFMEQYLGSTRSVLWEPSEAAMETSANTPLLGYTDNYLRVEADAASDVPGAAEITATRLNALLGEPTDRMGGTMLR